LPTGLRLFRSFAQFFRTLNKHIFFFSSGGIFFSSAGIIFFLSFFPPHLRERNFWLSSLLFYDSHPA
jgi:hypothetical protein